MASWKTTPISAIVDTKKTIHIAHAGDHLSAVLKTISTYNLQSLPVYEGDHCLGLVDLSDVVAFLVTMFYKKVGIEGNGVSAEDTLQKLAHKTFHRDDMGDAQKGMTFRFAHSTAKELINFSHQNAFKPLPPTATLAQVVAELQHVRRVPIVDGGKVVALVSHASVSNWLVDHVADMPFLSKTLEELKLANKKVVTVRSDARTIDAFATLHEHRISAVAIVDNSGKMVGNLSLKDLTAIQSDLHHAIQPVIEYVNAIRRENLLTTQPAMGVHPNDSLALVVNKLKTIHIHRIYVWHGENPHPSGIVSVGDVVRILSQNL